MAGVLRKGVDQDISKETPGVAYARTQGRLWEGAARGRPPASHGERLSEEPRPLAPGSWTRSLQKCEESTSVVQAMQCVVFCSGRRGRLTRLSGNALLDLPSICKFPALPSVMQDYSPSFVARQHASLDVNPLESSSVSGGMCCGQAHGLPWRECTGEAYLDCRWGEFSIAALRSRCFEGCSSLRVPC